MEDYGILSRELFARMLFVERKRTERSGRSFVLMLLESTRLLKPEGDHHPLEEVLLALSRSTRDTDTKGWYKEGSTIGVIFTELGADADGRSVANALLTKVTKALTGTLTISQINQISLTFHVYPEDWDDNGPSGGIQPTLYDDLLRKAAPSRASLLIKRLMDITGSLAALVLGLPLFVAIAIAIKLTSRGPVFFKQVRLGQFGRGFTFLKFRSMCADNDPTIHQQYVKRFISGENGCEQAVGGQVQYKLAADPRVTLVGRFLRKLSLDELPQFLNVLKGEMSLVGPRPPVPYEVSHYDTWHKARLLAAKPGITGLWQVAARSQVKFDDMVRLDLRYASSWTPWLDIKILLQTPQAVFSAKGAQ
jgi:lipopolysaccharide/colanic/teichoic acid biosynthesis glycosyltransferase